MKTPIVRHLIVTACVLALGQTASVADIVKTNNTDNLNLGSSWVGGVAPGASDVAVWDSTVAGANTTVLGADLSWAGVRIANPGGLATINAGNTLTLGASGINMSSASQDLTLNNNVTLGTLQNWSVASGRTLRLGGALARNAGSALRINLADGTSNVYLTNGVPNGLLGTNMGDIWFGTLNDTDYVALISGGGSLQVVGGATITGLYVTNVAGANPTIANVTTVVDFVTTDSYGARVSGSRTWRGVRFNIPQTYAPPSVNAVLYNGVPAWQMNHSSGRNITMNSILITTNVGTSAVLDNGGGQILIGNTGTQDLLIFQNNTAAPLVMVNIISQPGGGAGILNKMGAGRVELQNANAYSGGTRVYNGTLLVTGNGKVGGGPLSIFGGKFVGSSGSGIAPASTTVAAGGTNGVQVNAANGQFIITNSLTFGTGTSGMEFSYASGLGPSASTAPLLVVGDLTNNGTVSVDVLSGNLALGQFPLIKYTGTLVGAGTFNLGVYLPHTSVSISNNTANGSIDLVVTTNNQPLKWTIGSGVWDLNTTANWEDASTAAAKFQQSGPLGDQVVFEDIVSGTSPITVTNDITVRPASVIVTNDTKAYTITGSGDIAGSCSFTKSGAGTLTIETVNSFTGGININGGTLTFTALGNLGAGAINFDGGTLLYGADFIEDISARTVTFNAGGGTLDTAGYDVTFGYPVGNNGAGGLTKAGAGGMGLIGANNYQGKTTVSQGTLVLITGATLPNTSEINVKSGAVFNTVDGLTLGSGQKLSGGGTVINNVTAVAGASVSPGDSAGTLTLNNNLTINGDLPKATLDMDVSTNLSGRDLLVVNGDLTLTAGALQVTAAGDLTNGVYKLIQYSGTLYPGAGASGNLLLTGFSQAGKDAWLVEAAGEIDMVVGDKATDALTWRGTGANWDLAGSLNWLNVAAPWPFTNGDYVTFNDSGSAQTNVNITEAVRPSTVTVNATTNYWFSGAGRLSGLAAITKSGSGTLTILTVNNNAEPMDISDGTVQVGDGTTTGALGSGNVTNNGALVFMQTDNQTILGSVSGSGSLAQNGTATLTLSGGATYTGPTTIGSNATLRVGAGAAPGAMSTSTITNDGTLVLDSSTSWSYGNGITGLGGVVKQGSGMLTLSGANTYLGNTYVSNGVVKLAAPNVIPDGTSVAGSTGWLILDGGSAAGTVDLNGFNETVNALSGLAGTVNGMITNSGTTGTNTLTLGDTNTTTYAGTIREFTNGPSAKIALVKRGSGLIELNNNANTYSGGTLVLEGTLSVRNATPAGSGSITLSNGTTLNLAGNNVTFFSNPIMVTPNSTVSIDSDNLSDQFYGNVTGDAASTNLLVAAISAGSATKQWQSFPGTVVILTNAELRFAQTGDMNNGGDNTTFVVDGVLHVRNVGTVSLGALTGAGVINNPTVSDFGTFVIGAKGINTAFTGGIEGNNHIAKTGAGTLTLSSNFLHTGYTTISNGVLELIAPAMPSNSTNINVMAGAVLDARDIGYSSNYVEAEVTNTVIITNNTLLIGTGTIPQTLRGGGTIRGNVLVGPLGTVSPGESTGILTVTTNITLGGSTIMEVDRAGSPNSDGLVASSITYGGSLTVTNSGDNLFGGDTVTFTLFSGALGGTFTSIAMPPSALPPNHYWTNKVYVDGTVAVVSTVNTNPPVLTNVLVGGNTLQLSWAEDRMGGYVLQFQTNALSVGISTNWVTETASLFTNKWIVPIVGSNETVFCRLILQ